MLKVASYDIVFQEIPGEVTLALNLSGCPCHCPGCHSKHLWEDIGEELNTDLLDALVHQYEGLITCVCFMGGDQDPQEVHRLAEHIKQLPIKVAWYSGRPATPDTFNQSAPFNFQLSTFNYIKFGPYIESLGGLKSPATNQRLYQKTDDGWEDITSSFWKKNL